MLYLFHHQHNYSKMELRKLTTNEQSSGNKTEKKGFIISMDQAREIKFHLDVVKKEIKFRMNDSSNAMNCCRQIAMILNKAKVKNTIVLRER